MLLFHLEKELESRVNLLKKSTRKNSKRKIESKITDVRFIHVVGSRYGYPSTLNVDLTLILLKQLTEVEKLREIERKFIGQKENK